MKKIITIGYFLFPFILLAQSPFIHVDQFGYTPNAKKVAVLSDPHIGYNSNLSYTPSSTLELRDANTNAVIQTYTPVVWSNGDIDTYWSGDKGWWIDFSNITTEGEYYMHDAGANESSAVFEIKYGVYEEVLEAASKMFYYNRCNMDKQTPYAESNWTDGNNFENALQDANCRFVYDPDNASLEKDLTGGWFDAGDYNKYVTFTMSTLHNLLWAYRDQPDVFTDNFNIPESGNGIPDLIDEMIWELDWLLKMSNSDGTVHIKMGSISYAENADYPPSNNYDQRYYGPTCTSASLTVASVFAHAYTVLKDIPGLNAYANTLLARAEDAWDYAKPFYDSNTLELNCDDGMIKSGDADFSPELYQEHFIAAAIYLFEATGNSTYNDFVISEYQKSLVFGADFNSPYDEQWGVNYIPTKDAYLHYGNVSGHDTTVADDFRVSFENASINNNWENYYGASDIDLYRAHMPNYWLGWGSNQQQGRMGSMNLNVVKYLNSGIDSVFVEKAAGHIHYMHGVNPIGKVYLSNMNNKGAENSVDEIYHAWFADGSPYDNAQTSTYGPAPGFLAGGPNHYYGGNPSPPSGQPFLKSYDDFNSIPDASWEITEPAIYYQASYIRLLAEILNADPEPVSTSVNLSGTNSEMEIFPNPTNQFFTIQGELWLYDIEVINVSGQVVLTIDSNNTEEVIDVSTLGTGTYFIKMEHKTNNNLSVQKIIKE